MKYTVTRDYQSGLTRAGIGALVKGAVIDLDEKVAADINRDCAGTLVPWVEPKPEPEPVRVAAPAAPEFRSAPVVAPRTADPVVKRGPGRPPTKHLDD